MPRDEIPEPRDPVVDLITEINAEFMVVTEGGRVVIYKPERDPMLKRDHFVKILFRGLQKVVYEPAGVRRNQHKKTINHDSHCESLARTSRSTPVRPRDLRPLRPPRRKNDLNLWRGFAVNPKQGSWAKMQEHIREIICDGNEDHFDW